MREIRDTSLYEPWSYDGSSTNQAVGKDSEIILQPVSVFSDPFRKGPNVLVLVKLIIPMALPLLVIIARRLARYLTRYPTNIHGLGSKWNFT